MQVKQTAEIAEFLAHYAEELGAEIIEVKWDMRTKSLNVFLDAAGGVDLRLLETFHHAIDGPLDELDPTFGAPYTLNCSSAGLDRPFVTERDYLRHLGEKIEVRLYAPAEGKKRYEGELLAFENGTVVLSTEEGEKRFPKESVAKACLCIEL